MSTIVDRAILPRASRPPPAAFVDNIRDIRQFVGIIARIDDKGRVYRMQLPIAVEFDHRVGNRRVVNIPHGTRRGGTALVDVRFDLRSGFAR